MVRLGTNRKSVMQLQLEKWCHFSWCKNNSISMFACLESQLYFRHKTLQLQNIQFSNTDINIEIKTATAVIKNELKYFPMSEGHACIAEPNLEALPLIRFSKGLV